MTDLAAGIRAGGRASLARAITLVESERADHRDEAQALLAALLPETGGALRVGISGVPGAGKSTLIDALGMQLLEKGHRVAVLAVDPSSRVSGGSILGDKTRMHSLSRDERAFIRPSPSRGTLGGVAAKTQESMLLCEAAGFDVILVETVGVGQSETIVADMVDVTLVLFLAGGGDELQGIKRGILESVDVLAINKADGDNVRAATKAKVEYRAALRLMRGMDVPVLTCSATEGSGLAELWDALVAHRDAAAEDGTLARRRQGQGVRWMWRMVDEELRAALRRDPATRARLRDLEQAVASGTTPPTVAASALVRTFLER
ncbi:MAG: methylmalonyl Co-A mutase-associated GTPase MeaB [Myxococcota bacterium]